LQHILNDTNIPSPSTISTKHSLQISSSKNEGGLLHTLPLNIFLISVRFIIFNKFFFYIIYYGFFKLQNNSKVTKILSQTAPLTFDNSVIKEQESRTTERALNKLKDEITQLAFPSDTNDFMVKSNDNPDRDELYAEYKSQFPKEFEYENAETGQT